MKNYINLKRSVYFQNELNRITLLELEQLYPQLEQYNGRRIIVVNGLSSKFKCEFLGLKPKPFESNHFATKQITNFSNTKYSFYLNVSLCFNGGNYVDHTYYCEYVESNIYLGELENGSMLRLNSFDTILNNNNFTMINAEEEQKKFDDIAELEKRLESLKNSLRMK